MKKCVVYVHGMGGTAAEAEHYKPLFPERDVLGFDYSADTPWDAKTEFFRYFASIFGRYDEVSLIANSLGAYFTMCAVSGGFDRAMFISPVVDMEKLILGMMANADVSEAELRRAGEIPLADGTVLTWKYLDYVRAHPTAWNAPTRILYGENDALTSYETVRTFAVRTGAELTVMPGGEHWFHTPEQMAFLDRWITE